MRNSSAGAPLPPLLFNALPEPIVIETEGDSAWVAWDHAIAAQDITQKDENDRP